MWLLSVIGGRRVNRLRWAATYWLNGEVVVFSDDRYRWGGLPQSGVLRVVTWVDGGNSVVMSGMDNYYVRGQSCGMTNDEENRDWYEGLMRVRWDWSQDGLTQSFSDGPPPAGAILHRGVMVPDEIARAVGLLGPNDSAPVRSER